ncbi:MAG: hypothetical protein ACTMIV_10865 [Brevibacterium aurantiacum]
MGQEEATNRHLKSAETMLTAAIAFKEDTEQAGRHRDTETVLKGFSTSVAALHSAARAFERIFEEEITNMPAAADSLAPQELTQVTLERLRHASKHLAEAASALETAYPEGEGLTGHVL